MNESSSWKKVTRLLLTVAVLIYAVYSAFGGDWFMFQCLGAGVGLGLLFLLVVYPIKVKRMLVTAFSSFSHLPAHATDFPRLDLPQLGRLSAQWEELGFVQSGDFSWQSANPQLGASFSRLFEHQSEPAVVELLQQFTPTKTLPLNSLIESFWGQRNEVQSYARGLERTASLMAPLAPPTPISSHQEKPRPTDFDLWVFITHNRAPNRYFRVLRYPRVLGARLEANTSPARMWQLHQERAALIEARLATPALRGDLPTLLRAHGRLINDLSAQRIRATPAWKLALHSLNRKPAPPFHDGELAPLEP